MVKALRYYSDGPGIDSRWCLWIFQWHIPSDRSMALGSNQPPNENAYQEHLLGVEAAGEWGWQPHYLYVPNVMEIWEPKPPGTLWATPGLSRDSFTLTCMLCMYDKFDREHESGGTARYAVCYTTNHITDVTTLYSPFDCLTINYNVPVFLSTHRERKRGGGRGRGRGRERGGER